jgi:hypothetical protein
MKRRIVTNEAREGYRDQQCQLCSLIWATEVHEICSGPARQKALNHRETWLALCRGCHQRMHTPSDFSIERQLALKLLVDPEYFNLELVCQLRGRAPTAITLADVSPYLSLNAPDAAVGRLGLS